MGWAWGGQAQQSQGLVISFGQGSGFLGLAGGAIWVSPSSAVLWNHV